MELTYWQHRSGRDSDGDWFSTDYCVHGSGRVLAKVFGPEGGDEFLYRATFFCAVPAEVIDTNETFDFIDAESAIGFVNGILAQFDPVGKPQPKVAPTPIRTVATVT